MLPTEKLYDGDAYLSEFTATVLAVEPEGEGYDAVLDRTAFFPEAGGQSADSGTLEGARVLAVCERDHVIHHRTDRPLPVGSTVRGRVDLAPRYERMQCHTAEHILSGLLHSLYGLENVGFHLGEDVVTLDTSAPVTDEMMGIVSQLANRAVYDDLPVECRYPSAAELSKMTYRSKLALTDGVRLVSIPGIDACACCAPHVARTGEIGMILILAREKHKGGTRLTMLAGERARRYVLTLMAAAGESAALLSSPVTELPSAVRALLHERDVTAQSLLRAERLLAEREAERLTPTEGSIAVFLPAVGAEALRAFANRAVERVGGVLAVLTETEGGYRYLLAVREGDVRAAVTAANIALQGRGGGRGRMAEGRFFATREQIAAFFAT